MKNPAQNCRVPIADCRLGSHAKPVAYKSAISNRHSTIANSRSAFTMIEIALCLAIIGFALVAIIGVLPTGLNVQKDNREETIINQDAIAWMNAIRNGAKGYDDLTNYVLGITNYWTVYNVVSGTPNVTNQIDKNVDLYDRNASVVTSVSGVPNTYALTNGASIIGLLSTPKYVPLPPPASGTETFRSNYVVAVVRSFSGSAADKVPQANPIILEDAFTYRMIVENIAYVPFDPGSTNYGLYTTNTPAWFAALKQFHAVQTLMTNSHDLRLTFRWPILPNGTVGNRRVTFRAFTGGWLFPTTDFYEPKQPLYFFQPSTYVQ